MPAMLNNISLRWKVLSSVALTSIFAVIVSSVVMVNQESSRMNAAIERDSITLAHIIGGSTAGAMAFGDKMSTRTILGTLEAMPRVKTAIVYDDSRQPFAWYQRGEKNGDALTGNTPTSPGSDGTTLGDTLTLFQTITADGASAGNIYMNIDLSEVDEAKSAAVSSAIITVIVIGIIAGLVSLLVQHSIVGPINAAADALKDIAQGEGDLTRRLPLTSNDEVGELAKWFNVFIERIHGIIGDFSETAQELNRATDRLTGFAQDTERGVIAQQSDIDHVVTAVQEMANAVEDVTQNVALAANSAQQADSEANNGNQVVSQTMSQIENLSEDINRAAGVIGRLQSETDNIGSVLDVIRGIAEQTNLLALNAAIEAARAGEQGRGFAVVADEVRTLASRTQDSTQEIQSMIERLQTGAREAVQVMEKGTQQATESVNQAELAHKSLEAITQGVSEIHSRTTQIASATEQQSSTTREMDNNMSNIAAVAKTTADGATKMAQETSELASMAERMTQTVKQFKV